MPFATEMPDSELVISSFTGKHRFLSNFMPCQFTLTINGRMVQCRSSEHAFQAHKATNPEDLLKVLEAPTPALAKRHARQLVRRVDWNEVKVDVMRKVLLAKFDKWQLQKQLLYTGKATLIEGNSWGDTYWGVDEETGKGLNMLGCLLMETRKHYGGK